MVYPQKTVHNDFIDKHQIQFLTGKILISLTQHQNQVVFHLYLIKFDQIVVSININYLMILRRLMMLPLFSFSEAAQSIQGHKPPAFTDTPSGRYAGSLFTAASKSSSLQTVAHDLTHLRSVLKESASFRQILKNSAVRRSKQKQLFQSFAPSTYNKITVNFIDTLIDSGRLSELEKTIDTYLSYCKILNKQEDIRVISAADLNQGQKDKVLASLKKNKPGVRFKVTYEVDPAILGGLQIFAGSEFLDCSLRSRIQRLKTQLSKIA